MTYCPHTLPIHLTPTRSPILTVLPLCAPIATTRPMPSWPPISGNFDFLAQSALRTCKSEWQTPLYSNLIKHSPGASSEGCLTGWSVLMTNGALWASRMAAFWVRGIVNDVAIFRDEGRWMRTWSSVFIYFSTARESWVRWTWHGVIFRTRRMQ